MASNIEIYPDDGLKVLKLLRSVTKTKLPDYGLLAGQAVCSALLYLKGQDSHINVNDLDIFIPLYSRENHLYPFEPHHKIPRARSVYSTVERIDHNHSERVAWRDDLYQRKSKAGTLPRSSEEYEEIENEAYRLFPAKKENFWRFQESSFQLGYRILAVYRRGLKNIIFTGKPRSVVGDNKDIFSFDVEAMKVLKGFDLNSVQVGIDLKTGKIYYTPEFVGFLHSKQLRILQPYRPWHTIIRYFQKRDQHGYYGNDELAIAITATFHDLRTPELMEDLRDCEPEEGFHHGAFYGHNMTGLSNDIPRFGGGYIDKYRNIQNLLTNHFDLRIETVNVEKKNVEKAKSLPDKTQLGKLVPRYSGVGSVLGGSHRKSLQKQLGLKILNYPAYARCNLPAIIEDKFGLYGKRIQQRRSTLLDGLGKVNTRRNPFHRGPLLDVLAGRGDLLHGNIYQEGLEKVTKLLESHSEMRSRFYTLSLEDQITLAKRINWIEKNYPYLAFHVITGNLLISNDDLVNLDPDTLIQQIEVSYEAWLKKELARPALVEPLFAEVNLPDSKMWATELTHSGLLIEEGSIQRHCVGGYSRKVKGGRCRIVSFRKSFHARVTAELVWFPKQKLWAVTQFRTRFNRHPKNEFYTALKEWSGLMLEKGINVSVPYI